MARLSRTLIRRHLRRCHRRGLWRQPGRWRATPTPSVRRSAGPRLRAGRHPRRRARPPRPIRGCSRPRASGHTGSDARAPSWTPRACWVTSTPINSTIAQISTASRRMARMRARCCSWCATTCWSRSERPAVVRSARPKGYAWATPWTRSATTYGSRAAPRTGADGLPGLVVTAGDRVLLFTGHPIRTGIGWFAAGYADYTDAHVRLRRGLLGVSGRRIVGPGPP